MTPKQQQEKARSQALRDLAKKYPGVFTQLLNHRRAELGLGPVGTSKPGPKPKEQS